MRCKGQLNHFFINIFQRRLRFDGPELRALLHFRLGGGEATVPPLQLLGSSPDRSLVPGGRHRGRGEHRRQTRIRNRRVGQRSAHRHA